ncbi:hypothetical protein FO519_006437 [Halicephalobus sp. NKZ332]|nr:hypothetical protein FO519_006437 [Halicephalobus sp. NKZ332]
MGKLLVKKKLGDAIEKNKLRTIQKTKEKRKIPEKEKLKEIAGKTLNVAPAKKPKIILKKKLGKNSKTQNADRKKVQKTGATPEKKIQKSDVSNGKKVKSPVEKMKRKVENIGTSKGLKKPRESAKPDVYPEGFWILRYKTTGDSKAERCLFLKPHDGNDRGLTISNIPPFYGDVEVKRLLEQFVEEGKVLSVFTKRGTGNLFSGFKVMVAYFDSELWLQKFLENVKNSDQVNLDEVGVEVPVLGMKKYAVEYNKQFKPVKTLREEVEKAIGAYDQNVSDEKEAKEKESQVDEEGWTTVVAGRKGAFKAPKGLRKKILQNKAVEKVQSKPSEDQFYAQGKKIAKNEAAQNVHKKFEESKKKIAELRAKRKFNPI